MCLNKNVTSHLSMMIHTLNSKPIAHVRDWSMGVVSTRSATASEPNRCLCLLAFYNFYLIRSYARAS